MNCDVILPHCTYGRINNLGNEAESMPLNSFHHYIHTEASPTLHTPHMPHEVPALSVLVDYNKTSSNYSM